MRRTIMSNSLGRNMLCHVNDCPRGEFLLFFFFFFNDTATTEIYTLSLHDALPILEEGIGRMTLSILGLKEQSFVASSATRSEEHTSELQSPCNLVCRLLLEKKKTTTMGQRQWTCMTPLVPLQERPRQLLRPRHSRR